jgi:hypothetical protein
MSLKFGPGVGYNVQPSGQCCPVFEQLKQKYQPVFDTIQKEGGQVQSLKLDGNKLYLKATAKSDASKNRIRDAIKALDPHFDHFKHDSGDALDIMCRGPVKQGKNRRALLQART